MEKKAKKLKIEVTKVTTQRKKDTKNVYLDEKKSQICVKNA